MQHRFFLIFLCLIKAKSILMINFLLSIEVLCKQVVDLIILWLKQLCGDLAGGRMTWNTCVWIADLFIIFDHWSSWCNILLSALGRDPKKGCILFQSGQEARRPFDIQFMESRRSLPVCWRCSRPKSSVVLANRSSEVPEHVPPIVDPEPVYIEQQ